MVRIPPIILVTSQWQLSSLTDVKGELRCKMDLGYVWYDKEFERSMESKKNLYDAKLSDLFIADSTKLI